MTPSPSVEVLREARDALEAENERLRQGLRFYANKHHFGISDDDAWDTVSGEPQNFWCDEAGTATSAVIGHAGRTHHLGQFDTAEEASAAYWAAKRRLHQGCTK